MSKADKRARKRENKQLGRAEREAAVKRHRQRRSMITGGIGVLVVIGIVALLVWTGGGSKKKATTTTTTKSAVTTTTTPKIGTCKTVSGRITCDGPPAMTIDPAKTYTATITTVYGKIAIALDAKNAPVATNNFVFLARHHFYDGLKWHRVVKDFVIQGGDPKGDGSGGPGYSVKGEVPKSGYSIGSVAAAKTGTDPNGTMGSQFFIVVGAQGASLPPQYAKFGQVSSGQSVADKIASFANGDGPPTHTIYIESVSITES